jgi:hypothetical protein
MSYKKKQHWYITGRRTHHHTNIPQNKNKRTRHDTPSSSTKWERRSTELPTLTPSSPTLRHGEASTHCKPGQPLSSSTMGLSPSNCTYTLVDPSASVKLQQTFSSRFQGQPLILASLRGGLASSTASLLYQGLRYLRLHREHLLHLAVTEITTATCTTAQDLKHP